jgi:superfamily II DNA/RNA helicase
LAEGEPVWGVLEMPIIDMCLKARHLDLKDSLETLVVDEADLVFSFGYESEVKEVLRQ